MVVFFFVAVCDGSWLVVAWCSKFFNICHHHCGSIWVQLHSQWYVQGVHVAAPGSICSPMGPCDVAIGHNWTLPNPQQMLIHLQRLNYSSIPRTNSPHTYCTPTPTYHLSHTTDTAPPPHTAPMQAQHYASGVLRDPLSLLCLTLQLEIVSIFSLRTKQTRAQDLSRIQGLVLY